MMKVLIVDDDTIKIGKINEVLRGFQENVDIYKTIDIHDARNLLYKTHFDLLILDIQLPSTIGDAIKSTGGTILLNEIISIDKIKKPNYIVGITSFEDAKVENEEDFFDHLWSIIKFDPTTDHWKEQLINKINYILSIKEQESKLQNNYEYDIAIITAVRTEFESVMKLPIDWNRLDVIGDSTTYWKGVINTDKGNVLNVIVAQQHQMGMTSSGVLAMKIINRFRPRFLTMVGICAGNKKQGIELGDIIVAAESWDYGSGKIKEDNNSQEALFQPEPHQIGIDIDLKEKFQKQHEELLFKIYNESPMPKPKTMLQLHVGAVASGASVIQNEKIVEDYIDKHNRKLLGIEMEIYAIYFAATNVSKPRPQVFAIKSVCDFADASKNDNFQAYAAYTSSAFLYHFIIREL